MLCRLFCAAVVVCLAVNSATAQDPTKVEPKHYKLHFENDRVQVVDVHYGPHEKSAMHEHPSGVSVSVTGGHLRFTDQNGKVTEVYAKAGEARWFPAHNRQRNPDFSTLRDSSTIEKSPLPTSRRCQAVFRAHFGMHLKASFALWVAWYNFVRVNTAIRMTPCMAAGITGTI
jgi:beta-alanine degradation protein BauB